MRRLTTEGRTPEPNMLESTFRNFNMHFEKPGERMTFCAGESVSGNFSFDLTRDTKVNAVTMSLRGGAIVRWTTSAGRGRTRSHSAQTEFFCHKDVVMQENNAVHRATKLPAGRHVYPFSAQFPRGNFPSTFHGVYGRITYSLTVSIHRPWHLSKNFVTELNFVNQIDTQQPELWAPLSGSNSKTLCCLWCASGPITLTATMEKKAFTPGETVRIVCRVSNASPRAATPRVTLQQKQLFSTHTQHRRLALRQLAAASAEPVRAEPVQTHVLLGVPSCAPPTVSNCSILRVEYFIKVSLSIKGSRDLVVLFPIVLYDAAPPMSV